MIIKMYTKHCRIICAKWSCFRYSNTMIKKFIFAFKRSYSGLKIYENSACFTKKCFFNTVSFNFIKILKRSNLSIRWVKESEGEGLLEIQWNNRTIRRGVSWKKKETNEKSEKGNFNLQFKTLKTTSLSFYCSHRFL
jgi:hypothetical protein